MVGGTSFRLLATVLRFTSISQSNQLTGVDFQPVFHCGSSDKFGIGSWQSKHLFESVQGLSTVTLAEGWSGGLFLQLYIAYQKLPADVSNSRYYQSGITNYRNLSPFGHCWDLLRAGLCHCQTQYSSACFAQLHQIVVASLKGTLHRPMFFICVSLCSAYMECRMWKLN